MEKKRFRMPTAFTILFILIALVALATWFIPAGSYAYVDGVPQAGTYHAVPQSPQGVGAVLKAAFSGFYDAVDVCVFILMVGGFLGVVMKTGAVDAGVSHVIRALGDREKWLIPILMLLFGLGGTTYGMWEETMAFFPLLIPVFLAAGYDAVVGISVILLGAGAGVISSTVNPFATGIASVGSHVDYIVGTLNNIEIVLNHYHSVAFIHQSIYHTEQHLHIFEVQTCGWLIEDINCFAGISLCQFGCQLHSLTLASRKCARRLAKFDIAQPYFLQHFYLVENRRNCIEKLYGLIYRHVEDISNRFSLEFHLQSLSVIALSATHLTWHEHIGQKIHFHRFIAISITNLTSATLGVK